MTVDEVLQWLETNGTPEGIASMARFNIPVDNAYGIGMAPLRAMAKRIRTDHGLAMALWDTGRYEARILAAEIADPRLLDAATMDRWATDFDSWALCDHTCLALFDRTPHAWEKVHEWAPRKEEFVRRAAYALIWALSVHDKKADDACFLQALDLIGHAPADDRPLVRKAIDMALRAVGKRNPNLNAAARRTCARLMAASDRSRQWIGRHALRELESDTVQARLARRKA